MYKLFLTGIVCVLTLFIMSCKRPYEGLHLSHSYPHSTYSGMPILETINIGMTNGWTSTFHYSLQPKGNNNYSIKGTMVLSKSVDRYSDINVYLLLLNKGNVVKSIRMNTTTRDLNSSINFFKEFEADEEFEAITFTFKFIYYQ